jgi:FkbM family methyltransferase
MTDRAPGIAAHVARPVSTALRRAARLVPGDRRVKGLGGAKGRRRLQLRKLLAPHARWPVVLTTADGLRVRVSGDPVDEQIAQHVLGPRRHEYFPDWPGGVPGGLCILDLGAHHGIYAAAALHEYPRSRAICVEPSAEAVVELRANIALNGALDRVRVEKVALAPTAGEGELRHTADGSWGYSLYEEGSALGSERVTLATLHDVVREDRPDVVKCNAEGAEYTLFDQLDAGDLRPALIVVMVHPEFGDPDRLLAQAARMGYGVTRIGTPDRPGYQMWRSRA